jgi:hypothetical protein
MTASGQPRFRSRSPASRFLGQQTALGTVPGNPLLRHSPRRRFIVTSPDGPRYDHAVMKGLRGLTDPA